MRWSGQGLSCRQGSWLSLKSPRSSQPRWSGAHYISDRGCQAAPVVSGLVCKRLCRALAAAMPSRQLSCGPACTECGKKATLTKPRPSPTTIAPARIRAFIELFQSSAFPGRASDHCGAMLSSRTGAPHPGSARAASTRGRLGAARTSVTESKTCSTPIARMHTLSSHALLRWLLALTHGEQASPA